MDFEYKKIEFTSFNNRQKIVYRPIIPVTIFYEGKETSTSAMIDSGCDINLFDSTLAQILGINIKMGEEERICGIDGKPEPYWIHEIEMRIAQNNNYKYKVRIGFKDNYPEHQHHRGLLGQEGFFNIYNVKLDWYHKKIKVKKHRFLS